MKKETFSKKISEIMFNKTYALENLDFNTFLEKDENLELVFCLAYMTLSKEQIIKKDMKNHKRLERLTRMVNTKDIDSVFQPNFSKEMPIIKYAKETDNTWILDNIRDSIMHGVFDIDEERKCFVINNTQFDRELNAEIPFSWFIDYAKYDILSKKKLDKYTIRGFYYNKNKTNKKYLDTKKEVINNILFNVNINNAEFNVQDIEKRVREIFEECSMTDIEDSLIEKYRERINSEKIKYNEKYLVSFYKASSIVKETIEKEFPGTQVNIHIDNRKTKFKNSFIKKHPNTYHNYNLLYEELNNFIKPKGTSLLKYISNIIENIGTITQKDYSNIDNIEKMNLTNYILNGENYQYTEIKDMYMCYVNNLNLLRTIYLNVYGLSTLVINHENLYNPFFINQKPSDYGLIVYTKKPFLDYAQKEKNIIMKLLEKEIKLYEKLEQLNKCNNPTGKTQLTSTIHNLKQDIHTLESDLSRLMTTTNFIPYVNPNLIDIKQQEKTKATLDEYYSHFKNATRTTDKKKIAKIIGKILDIKNEAESVYTFSYCDDMKETLTIIRNSFSHIGRIKVWKRIDNDTTLILNDYDSDGKQSGAVITQYENLINLLRTPFLENEKTSSNVKK